MPTDRELDQLIDAALPSYSAAEPRPGLEHRILTRALAEPHRHKRLSWGWTLAIPVFVCLLIFLTLRASHPTPRSVPATARTAAAGTTTPPQTAPDISTKTASSLSQPKVPHPHSAGALHPAVGEPLPKQDVFPSSSPLTAQEQTLLAYNRAQLRATKTTPAGELEINPIRITELDIKPLAIPSLDLSANGRNDQQP